MTERVVIGRVGRSHGLDGSFVVEDASEDERWFAVGARVLAGGDEVEVVSSKRAGGRPVVKLDRAVPRGTPLEVERSALPAPDADEYYVFQLIGLAVRQEDGRPLGKVTTVSAGVANDVLELDSGLALPMVEDCVRDIDLEAGHILVAPGFSDPD
ncbi:MAG TPA: ribosome maturation factor RimM [Gaiellaceae bacterium]